MTDEVASKDVAGHQPRGLGEFSVLHVLGRGSQATVYAALQARPTRKVALKVFHAPARGSPGRFQRELRALATLDHPGVVRLYEAGTLPFEDGPRDYLAMELVEGRTLADVLGSGALSLRARVEVFADVCEGVHAAHACGVLHRDLKPSNILLDARGRPRIADFGSARLEADPGSGHQAASARLTRDGELLGTLAYMSPEQARGNLESLDPRSDVYSLGAILRELAEGPLDRPATRSKAGLRTAKARGLASALKAVLHKALAEEPGQRYASARALGDDVRRLLRGEPVRATAPSSARRLWNSLRRQWRVAVPLAGALVALGTALTAALAARQVLATARSRAIAERGLNLRVATSLELADLTSSVDALWPVHPASVPAMQAWIERAHAVVRRVAVERPDDADADVPSTFEPNSRASLIARVAEFTHPALGPLARVERRLADARALEQRTLRDFASDWREACEAIADARRSPRYDGLRIEPQLGLIPLGRNPNSGLWEFAVWDAGGTLPARDPLGGELWIESSSMVVLVLLPGGDCMIGAQGADPGGPNFDRNLGAPPVEPRMTRVAPFFLSKYETTKSQFERAMGFDPSYFEVGYESPCGIVGRANPVDFVDLDECREACRRWNLELPSEAQWEYAFRVGQQDGWAEPNPRFGSEHLPVTCGFADRCGLVAMEDNVCEWVCGPILQCQGSIGLESIDQAPWTRMFPTRRDGSRQVVARGIQPSLDPLIRSLGLRKEVDPRAREPQLGFRASRPLRFEKASDATPFQPVPSVHLARKDP